jgi:hypothetical protein
MKVGQGVIVNEFRGNGIVQNGQYLQIVGAENNIVVSLNLEPGYYLADVGAVTCSNEPLSATGTLRSVR